MKLEKVFTAFLGTEFRDLITIFPNFPSDEWSNEQENKLNKVSNFLLCHEVCARDNE